MSTTELTMTEKELSAIESKIDAGLKSFIEVGRLLMQVRDRNGFKLRGFATFDEYCSARFQIGARHGLRLIAAAETAEKVEKATGEAPRNEAVARELEKVAGDPKLIERVKTRLAKAGKSIATATAKEVTDVVSKVLPATRPMFDDGTKAKPKSAPAPASSELSDDCPKCRKPPARYVRRDDGWHCGTCNTPVMLGVVAAKTATCPECDAPVTDAALGFCPSCGVAL